MVGYKLFRLLNLHKVQLIYSPALEDPRRILISHPLCSAQSPVPPVALAMQGRSLARLLWELKKCDKPNILPLHVLICSACCVLEVIRQTTEFDSLDSVRVAASTY